MTIQEQQLAQYKQMIVDFLNTNADAPWKKTSYDNLRAIGSFLKATNAMTEEQEKELIKQAQNEAKKLTPTPKA